MKPTRVSSSRSADRRFVERLGVSRVRVFSPLGDSGIDFMVVETPEVSPVDALKYVMPTVADTKEGSPAE